MSAGSPRNGWRCSVKLDTNITDLKKQLFRIYLDIMKDMYGYGTVEIKIQLNDDMIIFFAKSNRTPALKAIEEHYPDIKRMTDYALFSEFKTRLKKSLSEKLGIEALAMLRDYDPAYQVGVTVVILEENWLKNLA